MGLLVSGRTTRPPGVGHDIADRLATGYGAQDADVPPA